MLIFEQPRWRSSRITSVTVVEQIHGGNMIGACVLLAWRSIYRVRKAIVPGSAGKAKSKGVYLLATGERVVSSGRLLLTDTHFAYV